MIDCPCTSEAPNPSVLVIEDAWQTWHIPFGVMIPFYTPTCPSKCGSSWTGHSYPVHDVSRPRSKPMPAGGRNFRAWSDAGTRLFTRRKRAGLRVVILWWLGIDELVLHSNLTKSNLHMIDRSWSKINPGHPRPIIFYYIYIYLYCSASIKFKNRLPESPGMLEDLLQKPPAIVWQSQNWDPSPPGMIQVLPNSQIAVNNIKVQKGKKSGIASSWPTVVFEVDAATSTKLNTHGAYTSRTYIQNYMYTHMYIVEKCHKKI